MNNTPELAIEQRRCFFSALFIAAFGLLMASRYFPESFAMSASALSALGLSVLMHELLEKNRRAIWIDGISPWRANRVLAEEISYLFLGGLVAALVLQGFLLSKKLLPALPTFTSGLIPLLQHNGQVLALGFFFALFYRAGGLMLILLWNAFHWSRSFLSLYFDHPCRSEAWWPIISPISILPHLLCEVFAYVLAGMAGVFLSRAVIKYRLTSPEMFRVSKACVLLLAISVLALILATLFEVFVAGRILNSCN